MRPGPVVSEEGTLGGRVEYLVFQLGFVSGKYYEDNEEQGGASRSATPPVATGAPRGPSRAPRRLTPGRFVNPTSGLQASIPLHPPSARR